MIRREDLAIRLPLLIDYTMYFYYIKALRRPNTITVSLRVVFTHLNEVSINSRIIIIKIIQDNLII